MYIITPTYIYEIMYEHMNETKTDLAKEGAGDTAHKSSLDVASARHAEHCLIVLLFLVLFVACVISDLQSLYRTNSLLRFHRSVLLHLFYAHLMSRLRFESVVICCFGFCLSLDYNLIKYF